MSASKDACTSGASLILVELGIVATVHGAVVTGTAAGNLLSQKGRLNAKGKSRYKDPDDWGGDQADMIKKKKGQTNENTRNQGSCGDQVQKVLIN